MRTILSFLFVLILSSHVKAEASTYAACSVLDEDNRAVILVIPFSPLAEFGDEKQIVARSCDSYPERTSFGWTTKFDCSKQIVQLKMIIRQLQQSGVCPVAPL